MVTVFMREKNTVNGIRIHPDTPQALTQLSSAESGIYEKGRLSGHEYCGIPAATASQNCQPHSPGNLRTSLLTREIEIHNSFPVFRYSHQRIACAIMPPDPSSSSPLTIPHVEIRPPFPLVASLQGSNPCTPDADDSGGRSGALPA